MQIPIENIYYLLCYAWDKLEEKNQVNIGIDDKTRLLDLFSKILINGTRVLLKRGIQKNYVSETSEFAGIKGKMELGPTLRTGLFLKQRTICTYDEFSADILSNQILVSTIIRLIRTTGLDNGHKKQLKSLLWMLPGIKSIELNNQCFNQVRMHRNNRFYSFLIKVCHIIFENTLPTEKPGTWIFRDFSRDENKMNRLFEAFLLNFYKKEFPHWKVWSEHILWNMQPLNPQAKDYLPIMRTDISIQNENGKTIMDAKYYREILVSNQGPPKVRSGHLYQIFSYLMNQRSEVPATLQTKGMLIYPTIDQELDLEYTYEGHHISVRTLNLNMNWQKIEERLKHIMNVS